MRNVVKATTSPVRTLVVWAYTREAIQKPQLHTLGFLFGRYPLCESTAVCGAARTVNTSAMMSIEP
jgi:hypothetical protein